METNNQDTVDPKTPQNPSLIDQLYTKLSAILDKYLEKNAGGENSQEINKWLLQVRQFYLQLSINKQKSFTFLLSTFVVFILMLIAFADFSWAYKLTCIWIAFVALNQIQAIAGIVKSITDIIILFTLVFLPEGLKNMIARLAKNVSILLIAIFFGWAIGPIYLGYMVINIFTNLSMANGTSDSTITDTEQAVNG